MTAPLVAHNQVDDNETEKVAKTPSKHVSRCEAQHIFRTSRQQTACHRSLRKWLIRPSPPFFSSSVILPFCLASSPLTRLFSWFGDCVDDYGR